ncbi:hypothetical protein F5Y16DRAFT_402904 [Xylariaceae sp. FL0255]|nr:hypothetical protein F5Y16DRAFT_402904 [Xylariaceae sp. FL0255]
MLRRFFECIGVALVVYTAYRVGDFVAFHLSKPSRPLEKYRFPGPKPTYALITGANGGIGYGIAQALVQHGFGVILLGRNAAKLDAAAQQLRGELVLTNNQLQFKEEYVRTMVLNPLNATPDQIDQSIQETIIQNRLKVSILVNNVGGEPHAWPVFREFVTLLPDEIDKTINLNARFMAHLTRQMLPLLAENGNDGTRSLIWNLSSGAQIGVPYQAMYAATKNFNSCFSVSVSLELENNPQYSHIDCLSLMVGDVVSQNNFVGLMPGSPDSETYGRCIVEKTDAAVRRELREMSPYWRHDLGFTIATYLPSRLIERKKVSVMQTKRRIVNEATRPKEPKRNKMLTIIVALLGAAPMADSAILTHSHPVREAPAALTGYDIAPMTWTGAIEKGGQEMSFSGNIDEVTRQIREIKRDFTWEGRLDDSMILVARENHKRSKANLICGVGGDPLPPGAHEPDKQTAVNLMGSLTRVLGSCSVPAGPRVCSQYNCQNDAAVWLCNDNTSPFSMPCMNMVPYLWDIVLNCTVNPGEPTPYFQGQEFDTDSFNVVLAYHKCVPNA